MQTRQILGATLLVAVTVAAAVAFPYSVFAQQQNPTAKPTQSVQLPTFRRPGAVGLAEMMAQPPSYSYGSSINVFVYEDDTRQIREVHVLGHADSDTCRKASSLVATAILEKGYDTRDLFVAGAGRVVYTPAPNLRQLFELPQVRQFRDARRQLQIAQTAVDAGAEGGQAELEQARKNVTSLELDPSVRAYSMSLRGAEAVRDLVAGLRELSDASGLVTVHRVRFSTREAIEKRIAAAVEAGAPAVVRFDDLAATLPPGAEAAMILPTISLRTRLPVTASLGSAVTAQQRFLRASEVNQNEIEQVVIGDARARLKRQIEQRDQQRESLDQCKKATPEQLDTPVTLNMECSDDGCFPAKSPRSISRRNYCTDVLPENQLRVSIRISETREQIARIEADRKNAVSALAAMNLESLVDSMLRDWELPVGRTQAAFTAWRDAERPRSWSALKASMSAERQDADTLASETTVFQVARQGAALSARPNHVIDVRRSVLVIDPRLGMTHTMDTWSQRRSVSVTSAPSIETLAADPGAIQTEQLLQAIEQSAPTAVTTASHSFGRTLFDTKTEAAQLRSRATGLVSRLEFNEQRQALEASIREDGTPRDQLMSMLNILMELNRLYQRHGSATPEDELTLARDVASVVLQSMLRKETTPAQAYAFANRTSLGQNAGGEVEFMNVLFAKFGLDAAPILRRAMASARKQDPDFVKQTLAAGKLPAEPSAQTRALQKQVERGLQLSEQEAIAALRTERSILTEGLLRQSVDQLLSEPAQLANAAKSLDQASQVSTATTVGGARVARERLREWISAQRPMTMLSRLESASLLENTSAQILRRNAFVAGEQLEAIWGYRTNAELAARARFEAGDYARAIDLLFPKKLPLMLAEPTIAVVVENETATGPVQAILVEQQPAGELAVIAQIDDQKVPLMRIGGLTTERSAQIARAIVDQAAQNWRREYSLADQLRRLRVPLSAEQSRLNAAFSADRTRLALLKAMVYGCSLPAVEVVPLSGRCRTDARRSRFDQLAAKETQRPVALTMKELVDSANLQIDAKVNSTPSQN
jgi:hypothetical protein